MPSRCIVDRVYGMSFRLERVADFSFLPPRRQTYHWLLRVTLDDGSGQLAAAEMHFDDAYFGETFDRAVEDTASQVLIHVLEEPIRQLKDWVTDAVLHGRIP